MNRTGTGRFITLEGGEGSGKSTQARLIRDWLATEGHPVMLTSEPGGTEIGQALRQVLMANQNTDMVPETELLLYIADRAQHVRARILPALTDGHIVISDRYHDSSVAYQHYARGVPMATLDFLFQELAGGLVPDLTIVMDLPIPAAMERIQRRSLSDPDSVSRFEEEARTFHERVREGFHRIAATDPDRVKLVDGNRDQQEVFASIQQLIRKVLPTTGELS